MRSIVLPRGTGQRPQVAPVVGTLHDVFQMARAIVLLTELESPGTGPSTSLLRQAFGLTPAEASLASALAAGKTLAEIAKRIRFGARDFAQPPQDHIRKDRHQTAGGIDPSAVEAGRSPNLAVCLLKSLVSKFLTRLQSNLPNADLAAQFIHK